MTDRFFVLCVAVGVTALAAGCGSGAGSPGGPSGTAAQPTGSAVSGGATLRGTVETGVAGASLTTGVHALSGMSGVRVSVVGGTAATTTDDAGQFELRGVAPGRVQLRFEASGIDDRLEIENLAEGQSLTISVHLSSAGAFLSDTDDHRNEASLRGRVDVLDGTRLRVAGRVVQTDGLTQILGRGDVRITLAGVRVGDTVEVEGANQADGSLYARKLKLEDGAVAEPPEAEVSFVGSIQGLSPLVVAGRTVVTDGSTRVLDRKNAPIALAALRVGDKVEVEGRSRSDGSVLASKIKQQD